MSNVFFTADCHFGHENIIRLCNRPFGGNDEMLNILIENWNKKVPKVGSTVYHLGDFAFKCPYPLKRIIGSLNGKIIFIEGNHDRQLQEQWQQDLPQMLFIKYPHEMVLCHYAMRTWNKSHHGAWHLYGHTHGKLPEDASLSFDVGVDVWNFTPVSFEEVEAKMKQKLFQ